MKFAIKYALGGGFGGCEMAEPEIMEFDSRQEAEDYAYEMACEEYDQYDGLHGLRSVEQIMEEDEIEDYDEAYEAWMDERESWLDWEVEEVK
jgi:hypothetical protein